MSKTTKYKLKMITIYCSVGKCDSSLKLPIHEMHSLTMAGMYQRWKWFVSPSWDNDWNKGLDRWDGYAFCRSHEDEAQALMIRDEDS